MNARRNQVYNALFRAADGAPERLTPDRAIAIAELEAELAALGADESTPAHLVGDGCAVTLAGASNSAIFHPTPPLLRDQNAYSVAICALRTARAGRTVTDAELVPVYLRPCQAERERLERLKKGENA